VLSNARELDRQEHKRPLHGLPVGVKDVIATFDMPTQHNSPLYRGHRTTTDAACVALLRQAGALILGKTDTVEFAGVGRRALTRNPHDVTRTPGGSSSGSGAAVADFHVPVALGTQTGGSTIRPASYCGVFAMKPTWNAVNTEGVKRYSTTLDTVGWYGRSVEDLALLARIYGLTGAPGRLDDAPAAKLDVEPARLLVGSRIAVFRQSEWSSAEPATVQAMGAAVRGLRSVGAVVEELELPSEFERLVEAQKLIMQSEGAVSFLADYACNPERAHLDLRAMVEGHGHGQDRRALAEAYDLAGRCSAAFDRAAGGYDGVLSPSATGEAPVGLAKTGDSIFNRALTLLHVPCIALPGFHGPAGMPVGLTLTGPRYADARLLSLAAPMAALFEREGGWQLRPQARSTSSTFQTLTDL
ncbi:MAG: amidase, partial [Rhizobacter sp.]|nr:amidase [Rhizobacter sp.]